MRKARKSKTSPHPQLKKGSETMLFTPGEKGIIAVLCVIVCVLILLLPIAYFYNGFVNADIRVNQADANIKADLERRADLIPNMVSTIQASGKFEESTLMDVVNARSQAEQVKTNINSAQSPDQIDAQENSLNSVIGRLLLIYEQYPTLKTTDQYLNLENQLASTEDQIRKDRQEYNTAVADYQMTVKGFPAVLISGFSGFPTTKYQMFTTNSGSNQVPVVNFKNGGA